MSPGKRGHLVTAAIFYALWIVYSSLVLGPEGFNFVAMDAGEAWRKFLAIRFVDHGADQRPDWIANLLLLIPLGYLLMASLRLRRTSLWISGLTAFLMCFAFILGVKYAQLFFPPRTATLNYITSQTIGAALGILLSGLMLTRVGPMIAARFKDGKGLLILLGGYTVCLIVYFLMPLDIVMDREDVAMRLRDIPKTILDFPGEGRGIGFRALLILGDTLALAPVGMFIAVLDRSISAPRQLLRGVLLVVLIEIGTLLVLSASPYAIAVVYRIVGIWIGLFLMRLIRGKDLRKRHYIISRYVPVAIVLYAMILIFTNGLLTREWVTWEEASNSLQFRQMLPFWNFYIVSKVHATQSLAVHIVLYVPIGVMIWIRRGFWRNGARFSAFIAFSLSLLIELGRWLKPGLRPDFTDPLVAAAAAAIAFKAMPTIWALLEREAMMTAPTYPAYIPGAMGDPPSAHPAAACPKAAPGLSAGTSRA